MTDPELTPEEARVVGSLAEKALATPQYYPLTLNALVAACNQSNNRDPVVDYDTATVERAIESLRAKGYARLIHPGGGSRATKYRHTLDEKLGLDRRELSLVTVMLLRGPQTLNELRTRTERMAEFDGVAEIEHDLDRLANREPPLVVRLERQPGQKEPRVATTLAPIVHVVAAERVPRAEASVSIPVPSEPRIPPVDPASLDGESREILERLTNGELRAGANLFATLAHNPKLLRDWARFGGRLLMLGSVPARERELVILRTGWRCRSAYEFGQHVLIARAVGVTDEEIARVKVGPDADGWSDGDRTLLRLVDELHDGVGVTDATWSALAARYDNAQLVELVKLVGQYHLVAMVTNAIGVQREDGVPGLD